MAMSHLFHAIPVLHSISLRTHFPVHIFGDLSAPSAALIPAKGLPKIMWSPTNQSGNATAARPSALNPLENSANDSPAAKLPEPVPAAAPRNASLNPPEQASIGRSLVIKGDVSGSESLYIEGKVHGSISLAGSANRVTVGKTGVVVADLHAREIVVMGKVQGNLVA